MGTHPDGSNLEVFAHGLRNIKGFVWYPETRELLFTENGRDCMKG
jgi:glucose/arabinose dehydrogenase